MPLHAYSLPEDDTSASRARRRFLNRLLGLPVAKQNLLFGYFSAMLAAEIRAAKVSMLS